MTIMYYNIITKNIFKSKKMFLPKNISKKMFLPKIFPKKFGKDCGGYVGGKPALTNYKDGEQLKLEINGF